ISRAGGGEVASCTKVVDGDERGVVLDPRPEVERADEVVRVLSRCPRRPCAETERLVEGADAADEVGAQERRRRVAAVPHVLPVEQPRRLRPPGRGAAARVLRATGEAVQL